VHFLFNNAGLTTPSDVIGPIWETSLADCELMINVNLRGTIHGIKSFLPRMLAQDIECHIVNTASTSGLICTDRFGYYQMTKHGIVSLTETLYLQLTARGAKVGVSLLCPRLVKTRALEAAQQRHESLHGEGSLESMDRAGRRWFENLKRSMADAMNPAELVDMVFEAIQTGRFYILPLATVKEDVRVRMENILEDRNPSIAPTYIGGDLNKR
jgi:short-subunit dehydrogenase